MRISVVDFEALSEACMPSVRRAALLLRLRVECFECAAKTDGLNRRLTIRNSVRLTTLFELFRRRLAIFHPRDTRPSERSPGSVVFRFSDCSKSSGGSGLLLTAFTTLPSVRLTVRTPSKLERRFANLSVSHTPRDLRGPCIHRALEVPECGRWRRLP
jgi:hypothetical protein